MGQIIVRVIVSESLPEGGDTGDVVADNEGVHLVGALIGPHALQVVRVPQWRVIQGDAIAAEHGPGVAADLNRLTAVVQLADLDLMRLQGPSILHPPDLEREEHPLVDLQGHIDQLFLRQLVAGERLVELHPGP